MMRRLGIIRLATTLPLIVALAIGCGDDDSNPIIGGDASTGSDGSTIRGDSGATQEMEISGDIVADATWTADTVYILTGLTFIMDGVTLTIEAGTTVLGDRDSALIATRGGKLMANGTAAAPIVFSSSNAEGNRTDGDWGGVAMLGSAPINKGACVGGTGDGCTGGFWENKLEGVNPDNPRIVYGGDDTAHDCGSIRYARIEFAGFPLMPDDELNGLTVGGCGTDTELSFIQVHRGKDDGVEFFGGTAGMDHVLITGAADDSLDWDQGYRGNIQFLIIQQFAGRGDNGFESDGLSADDAGNPDSNPTIWNATLIGNGDKRGMLLREGTRGTLKNFLITNWGVSLDIRDQVTGDAVPDTLTLENSLFFDIGASGTAYFPSNIDESDDEAACEMECETDNPGDMTAVMECIDDENCAGLSNDGVDEEAAFMQGDRANVFGMDPMIGTINDTIGEYTPAGDGPAASGAATPTAPFDTNADYIGAVEPGASTPWYEGWTAYPEN